MKKVILFLLALLVNINSFSQSIGGTNILSSKTNIQYQFNYEYKTGPSGGAFTNTIRVKTPTNSPAFNIHFSDNTNEYVQISTTNNSIYITTSNADLTLARMLVISITNGVVNIWADGTTVPTYTPPMMGEYGRPWQFWGTNSLFYGYNYGFFQATNVSIQPINVSGNGTSLNSFTPLLTTPGWYEVTCTSAVTQACVGAVMNIGCVASNWAGWNTNWLVRNMSLASITNMSGSAVVSNINNPLAWVYYVTSYGSGTALGYMNFSVRQIQ